MRKLNYAICPKCNKNISRHDPNRIKVQVNHIQIARFQKVYKYYHLACTQGMELVEVK